MQTEIRSELELIDTWWDVNEGGMLKKIILDFELIDTWWDVNLIAQNTRTSHTGINRYMVGCKSKYLTCA